jgi:hypothetical protein
MKYTLGHIGTNFLIGFTEKRDILTKKRDRIIGGST